MQKCLFPDYRTRSRSDQMKRGSVHTIVCVHVAGIGESVVTEISSVFFFFFFSETQQGR